MSLPTLFVLYSFFLLVATLEYSIYKFYGHVQQVLLLLKDHESVGRFLLSFFWRAFVYLLAFGKLRSGEEEDERSCADS